jgi:hypothetical protein
MVDRLSIFRTKQGKRQFGPFGAESDGLLFLRVLPGVGAETTRVSAHQIFSINEENRT